MPPANPANGPARAGYSLVELLVVIGIIAVLIAILLPVIAGVRRAADATACLATLHQWGAAYQMYVSDHRGRSFALDGGPQPARSNPPMWWEQLEPYHPRVEETLLCPEATEPANVDPADAFHAWGPMFLWPEPGRTRMSYVGSYGVNGWLYRPTHGPGHPGVLRMPPRRGDLVPVIFDSAHFHPAPRDTDPADFDPDDPVIQTTGGMRRVALHRHRKGVNVVFADGHAAHVPVPDLWQLQWSQDFKPRAVTMR